MRALPLVFLLAACVAPAAHAEPYPFEGKWDCEVATFTFSATTYNNGDEDLEILDISQDGTDFVLTFADDYQLGLGMNDDGTMSWFSMASGDGFTCKPLN